jgi:hypothetical protein
MSTNNSMNELLEASREAHNKEKIALEEEVTRSQEQFKTRLANAQRDPSMSIEVNDETSS